ncbi:efflux RND transporter permease subunit [Pseudodesulfovibrio indicus]|jgi:Cu(I)/Ag(I) efflux system membrane protein CusA/SilA|uniref:Acriflavine resistance protein B n=1 Tax=Pseudodesulfovibrio indicus TaxID=1716143 RepID=A0A126QP91_9BACT|nr:efflux RND transporter permease subunit [Pseudodesulfovibrio indicus]AMK11265.1 acriflavine resistance protein B [Pseudodesulfovibrio indicus]TDT92297.1 Cu(I)/Ag(I) efflux system membrane protein CusA/SilA [Pseudodesulfovibrio indicus]
MDTEHHTPIEPKSPTEKLILFCLTNKLIVFLIMGMLMGWGLVVAPFDWQVGLPRDPVPVDAIPDIGENQQIVFTQWMGRSPQDMEDQVTYPLTVALLGIPGVKTVRSYSMFGFSTIYVIFNEDVEFYWSRSRLLEKVSSLPPGTLPQGIKPTLGPDATALGQVFWYTLEGHDENGKPVGGWDPDELRSIQDWYVRYALLAADGVSETASVGGFVKEYQIDVDPDALRTTGVTLEDVFSAVRMSNLDVGARTIEINSVEYLIRGIGFVKELSDIELSVIKVVNNVPIRVQDVAKVTLGPALRRGVLDKGGSEAVGGVVVARYGENPLQGIKNVKEKIKEISPGLPSKVLPDGTVSKVTIVPFYDRSGLINETLGTLNTALTEEILITVIVVLLAVMHLKSSLLISSLLPMAVMMCFIGMKVFRVDANIVALSGIAIAIGTMVDMGIIICENILHKFEQSEASESRLKLIFAGASEVGSAIMTAVATTIVSFLPVFAMEGPEGKLFKPLAYTKTFALVASIIVALTVLPAIAHIIYKREDLDCPNRRANLIVGCCYILAGLGIAFFVKWWIGVFMLIPGIHRMFTDALHPRINVLFSRAVNFGVVSLVLIVLATHWLPLGPEKGDSLNVIFVASLIGGLMAFFQLFQRGYPTMLRWVLNHKAAFMGMPVTLVLFGGLIWLGGNTMTAWLPDSIRGAPPVAAVIHAFPGLGKEFMPPLDEGSFLYMPTTMPHASIGEVQDVLSKQDMSIVAIPEVESAVGKLGRAETPLDPAPVSMIETVINYKSEYLVGESGNRLRFRFDENQKDFFRSAEGSLLPARDGLSYIVQGYYPRDDEGKLIPDVEGKPFRQWRSPLDPDLNPGRAAWKGITSPNDIWDDIAKAASLPGVTSAPKLQPIAARIVMLQSGMRAPMGIKVKGPDLPTIESFGMKLEKLLKEVPSIEPAAVVADRIVGKPYLEIVIDREAIAQHGIRLQKVQDVIEVAVGGKMLSTTIEGRERYPMRVRYMRELRDSIEALDNILVSAPSGEQIPLQQLTDMRYIRGPQVIKSEDTFLIGYVLFDKKPGFAEVDVVESTRQYIESRVAAGELEIPNGVTYEFAGNYENQVRAQKKLAIILPLALLVIVLILYLQFKSVATTLMVFSGILVAWSGGFLMVWLYGQDWFLNFSVLGTHMRDLFQVHPINLSVAIWVGFLALFGIASDDGVIMATYLDESRDNRDMSSVPAIREAILEGAKRRIRPALMTSATTILALIPVLTSTGRGADIMVPMAIPSFGGMTIAILTVFLVPTLYCLVEEMKFNKVSQCRPRRYIFPWRKNETTT